MARNGRFTRPDVAIIGVMKTLLSIPAFRAVHLVPYVRFLRDVGTPVDRLLSKAKLPTMFEDDLQAYLPLLPTLDFARTHCRLALAAACERHIAQNFPLLQQWHDAQELEGALGAERVEALRARVAVLERSKAEFAALRSGAVVEAPRPEIDDDADLFCLPLEALQAGVQWPRGVDAARREQHLDPAAFERLFGMDKAAFAALPRFVQVRMKRPHGLF